MSPLPARMADHWWQRPGRSPGRLQYHWHVLFRDQPGVHEIVEAGQRKLADVPGLDLVPLQWLHLTTLIVGFADETSDEQVAALVADARTRLAGLRPIPVSLGRVFYHPEAVVLPVEPLDALAPILDAVSGATAAAGCDGHTDTEPWLPHITIAYSHTTGPAAPVIAALGKRLPETRVTIRSVSLVAQTQVGRSWQWRPVVDLELGPGGGK
jgi:2'-5' RNA ligase